MRLVSGKMVVNVLVPDAPHKDLALERERAHFTCDTVIYVGDDETDEDVLQIDHWSFSEYSRETTSLTFCICTPVRCRHS